MEYKVGDKLLCKRNTFWPTNIRSYKETIFNKDRYYIIDKINKNWIDKRVEVHLKENDGALMSFPVNKTFTFTPPDNIIGDYIIYVNDHEKSCRIDNGAYIKDLFYHFYTKVEERKLKLEKLNT